MASTEPVWPIQQHTKAKHTILRKYLGAWFPILTSRGHYRRIIYLDGFAGPGIYKGGELGSPLIALETLVNHPHFNRWSKTEFIFIFIEEDKNRYNILLKEIDKFWLHRGGRPQNIAIDTWNNPFIDVAISALDARHRSAKRSVPTFAFIDPFGWSYTPIDILSSLLSSDKCEILLSFMYDSINRFLTDSNPTTVTHLTNLFGTDEFREVKNCPSPEDRKRLIRNLYARRLRETSGLQLVRSFDLYDHRNHTANMLTFGTRSLKGLKAMKEAMWSLDPVQGYSFHGLAGDQQMLFSPKPDITPLRRAILERFAGVKVSVRTIERFVIEETDYLTTHYKRQVLKVLEEEGIIKCVSPQQRRYSYPPGTMLQFSSNDSTQLF